MGALSYLPLPPDVAPGMASAVGLKPPMAAQPQPGFFGGLTGAITRWGKNAMANPHALEIIGAALRQMDTGGNDLEGLMQRLDQERQQQAQMAWQAQLQQHQLGEWKTEDQQEQAAADAAEQAPESVRPLARAFPQQYAQGAIANALRPQMQLLTPQEVAAAGFQPHTVVQRNPQTGELNVQQNPYHPPASASVSLSDTGQDFIVRQYLAGGRAALPPGIARNQRMMQQIIDRAAQLSASNGVTPEAALFNGRNYEANGRGLDALQRQRTLVQTFERTALANLQLAEQLSRQVPRSDYPMVNRAIIEGRTQTGNTATARYINAVISARLEVGKVMSGSTGSQGLTDSGRREAEEMFSPYLSPEQFTGLLDLARTEMHNRVVAFDDQEEYLRGRMTGQGQALEPGQAPPQTRGTAPAPATPTPRAQSGPVRVSTPAEAQRLAPGTEYITPDGRHFRR